MLMPEIANRLRVVMARTFGVSDDRLPWDPSQQNIEAWDSLGHLRLILAVEEEFRVQFSTEKISKLNSQAALIKELQNAIGSHAN